MAVLLQPITIAAAGTTLGHVASFSGTLPANVTAAGGNWTGTGVPGVEVSPNVIEAANFELNVTAAATLVGDTLDVYVQYTIDGGQFWDDLVHFAQVLGNGGVKVLFCPWSSLIGTPAAHAQKDGTMAAATAIQGPAGNRWRVKAVVVGTGSFSFAVYSSGFNRG